MASSPSELIGFACAYTPLPVLAAAGCVPYRILPMSDSPDQAGMILHDNLCPHVKRILDRALSGDLPELRGMVFLNSCDAMRRLHDAWCGVHGASPAVLVDLPPTADRAAVAFFAEEIDRLARTVERWCGRTIDDGRIRIAVKAYNVLCDRLAVLASRAVEGTLAGGSPRLQVAYNTACTRPFAEALEHVDRLLSEQLLAGSNGSSAPVYLFGNLLPDPEALALFEACGVRIVGQDLCSGSRLFSRIELDPEDDVFIGLARAILSRPRCARTLDAAEPGRLARDVLDRARASGARGVICHTVKFCDPYLVRLPLVREILQEEGIPLLVLEGDCTLRSIGQHRTRIEAFVEMLR